MLFRSPVVALVELFALELHDPVGLVEVWLRVVLVLVQDRKEVGVVVLLDLVIVLLGLLQVGRQRDVLQLLGRHVRAEHEEQQGDLRKEHDRACHTADDAVDAIVVTGYRKSLAQSTVAKRETTGFADAIFAEDIGKFPDSNIAESFNRVPGITITQAWFNGDISLEEFGFTAKFESANSVRIFVGERDPLRALSGDALVKALNEEVRKQTGK